MQINDENESTDVFGVVHPKQNGAMHGFFWPRYVQLRVFWELEAGLFFPLVTQRDRRVICFEF